ncbi:MAG: Gfo/Idh/MocA family oxidoreductase [Chloroflexi bacterium]|nr:Gfo/Idh/MocA family oxidoreductase [Chloroflexota bacterium]
MASDDPVRLAILGAGTIGSIHGLCVEHVPATEVSAVWSRSGDKAHALAGRLDARVCSSVAEAVSRPDVDAVLVCTPTFLHEEHALAAIRAGKHVICEKPVARTLPEAARIIEAAQRAGVHLLVAHVVRFFPEFRRLHDLVLDGTIGRPALVRMSRAASFPRGSGDWHNDLERSGGVLLDMGIHDLDWLLWTFGPARRIHARGLLQRGQAFLDYALVTLRLASDAIAHVECSWAEREGFRVHEEVSGDAGLLTYDSEDSTALRIDLRHPPARETGVEVPTTYTAQSPYVLQLQHFARCIQGLEELIITPAEAYEALRVSLAGLEAIRSGQPQEL